MNCIFQVKASQLSTPADITVTRSKPQIIPGQGVWQVYGDGAPE